MVRVYLDIETTSQKADDGMIIAIGIIKGDVPEVKFIESFEEEKRALEWLGRELKDCDEIVTWYGSGFDIPFLITRAVFHGIELNITGIPMLDLCEWSRGVLLLNRYSLEAVANFLGIKWSKDFHGGDILSLFKLAKRGNLEARKFIVDHCREDILVLKKVHEKLSWLIEDSGRGSQRKASKGE
ncbi:MAG: ribonuclease H-like domain-containing protein [Candidatus Hadarchaeales archaeon]